MSNLRLPLIKQYILLLLCLQAVHQISEGLMLCDDFSIAITMDMEDSEQEEELEIKEFHKIANPIIKYGFLGSEKLSYRIENSLHFYPECILDFQTPPPERLI